jgi:hypothetical protein
MSLVLRKCLLMTRGMRVIALCAGSLLVNGCISTSFNLVQSERESSAPPDPRMCAYAWKPDGAFQARAEQLASSCPSPRPERTAALSVYMVEGRNKPFAWVVSLPMAALSYWTLSLLPVLLLDDYVVCVQAASADGLNRLAIAEGSIVSLQNGLMFKKGKAEPEPGNVGLMRDDLTSESWRKLWLPQGENSGTENCAQKVAAIRLTRKDTVAPSTEPGRRFR